MNYFGLFFSATLPGVIFGMMLAAALAESERKRHRARNKQQPQKRGLYIENLKEAK